MANNTLYNQLLSHLTRSTNGALTTSKLGEYTTLSSVTKSPAETLTKPTAQTDTKLAGFGAKVTTSGIKFGSPAQKTQPTTNSSTNWKQLASSVASGGLASLVSSGVGSLGLGSIVSGLLGLFKGGSKTPPPLTLFQLPASQDVTVYTGRSGSTVYQGSMDQTVTSKSQRPIYSATSNSSAPAAPPATSASSLKNAVAHTNTQAVTTGAHPHAPISASTQPTPASVAPTEVNSQWFMERSSDIAAAVRNAMLNSSSLNDVVAEI
jgi:hypothetical protein